MCTLMISVIKITIIIITRQTLLSETWKLRNNQVLSQLDVPSVATKMTKRNICKHCQDLIDEKHLLQIVEVRWFKLIYGISVCDRCLIPVHCRKTSVFRIILRLYYTVGNLFEISKDTLKSFLLWLEYCTNLICKTYALSSPGLVEEPFAQARPRPGSAELLFRWRETGLARLKDPALTTTCCIDA